MDKSSQSISDSTLETAAPFDPSHGKGSFSPSMAAAGRHFPKQDTSATSSASRESSPTRRFKTHLKKTDSPRSPGLGPVAGFSQSKKKSSQEIRSARSTILPLVSATQRALSVSSIHSLPPDSTLKSSSSSSIADAQRAPSTTSIPNPIHNLHSLASDSALKTSVFQKSLAKLETNVNNRWPISQRLRTPPPSTHSNLQSTRNNDTESSLQILKMANLTDEQEQILIDSDPEDSSSFLGMRTPARGVSGASSTLETVQELSQPNTPISGLERDLEKKEISTARSGIDQESQDDFDSPKTIKQIIMSANESGNESAGKGDSKAGIAPSNLYNVIRASGTPSKSFKSIGIGKGKPSSDGFSQNMTVETETVSSVSQISVGPAGLGIIGSLRVKPSNETIRPRKEKKKGVRRPPSLTSGAASSKADIFEAKVASAVDEATSSDSEETFVYESNPPESNERPRRFQSRTPSTTSMVSQAEQRNGIRNILDGHQIIVMKKSMKFTNSHNNPSIDHVNGEETGKGTVRSSVGTGKGTAKYHHVNSRWGRHAGNSHPSLFDDESTFSNVTSSRLVDSNSRRPSHATSPRTSYKIVVDTGKDSSYNADHHSSERTPLLRSARPIKLMHPRRQNGSIIQVEQQTSRPMLSRCKGCLALCIMLLVVISGAVGFIYATTQPLVDVEILALNNLYASDRVLVFDLVVQAKNPNLVAVTIEYTDLVLLAQSRFSVDLEDSRRSRPLDRRHNGFRTKDNVLKYPPLREYPTANTNLEVGHIYALDIPLTFEGSPFKSMPSTTTGQISIVNPGNNTIPDGSDLWREILKHDFNLILRGRLNYTLPFNQKMKSVRVEFRILITPDFDESSYFLKAHIQR
ncbi:hypothetical protein EPUL_000692 [Erysiphe pulchra]|uniref:Uncharacterized protein n=1 Tax=Erysiphe pulchra TaxID=225359 RepID=A0A2S4Q0Y1_9PEZI|nr:hypothetical protein EPUL_000692 [Erysiphe pulchra]